MLQEQDLKQIEQLGITAEQLQAQLERLGNGFPWLKIEAVATVGNGIMRLSPQQQSQAMKRWKAFQAAGGRIEKFVPASGVASRMFKNLFAFVAAGKTEPETDFEQTFFSRIEQFAFFGELNKTCQRLYGQGVQDLMAGSRYADVVKALLGEEGLNYGNLPKALLKFHKAAAGSTHTPVEEHLEEGAQYAVQTDRQVQIHFTVSPEHRHEFNKLLSAKQSFMEKVWGVKFNITMSEQKPSTNTVAVTTDGKPYRDSDGRLLFRPAGHGALLANLNERDADVIFIKNIDNVVPLRLRHETTRYKKVLGGYLIETQQRIKHFMQLLDRESPKHGDLMRALDFVEKTLCTSLPGAADLDDEALAQYLRGKLNRPLRVCGVVANEGEPGGGPYLAHNADGSVSPQILEAAQINPDDTQAAQLMKNGTHFNPVDLVCYIRDYKGEKFDLSRYVDAETGLICMKSKDGVDIKVLELPGLWNGSMSDWNTVFVEVPLATFNPVKTVNDLLRNQHQ